jgi:thioredoxin 1
MNRINSKAAFKNEVVGNTGLSLVQFKKEWNGACQIISPIYEELARSYTGQARFFVVDVEQVAGIEHQYGVMEIPTILFFRAGEIIDHLTGLAPKNVMIAKIENALSGNNN